MTKRFLVFKVHRQGLRGIDLETKKIYSTKNEYAEGLIEFDTVEFEVEKEWTHGGTNYLAGEVIRHAYDPAILTLLPEHTFEYIGSKDYSYLNDEDDPEGITYGKMKEYLFTDYGSDSFYTDERDPIMEAQERPSLRERYNILTHLWEEHPTCIDALVHLGIWHFNEDLLLEAERFYSIALFIAEKNIPPDFKGVFPYGYVENRPYYRALHGMCLTLWRLKRFDEALEIAKKGYRFDPEDNTGFRFIIDSLIDDEEWSEEDEYEVYDSFW